MKKFFLIVFILIDFVVIAASALFLIARLKSGQNSKLEPFTPSTFLGKTPASPPSSLATPTTTTASSAPETAAPAAPAAASMQPSARKILFTYRSARARQVKIRAEFTGWRAEPMEKDSATNTWKYMAALEPGEYAYIFSVDDKSVRDPANKRTKKVGTTMVSAIVVQMPAAKPR